MYEKEKELKQGKMKESYDLNLSEFYKELNKAIITKNAQSLYGLSKKFNRHYFKKSLN
jgi:hypothetical protein